MSSKTTSAGGVVIGNGGKVLVVSQNGNSWSLPKGHVEAGEDESTAAKREIYEESGVKQLQIIRKLGTYERFRIGLDGEEDKAEFKSIAIYLMTTDEIDLKPVDPYNPEARWVQPDKVESLLTHPKDKEFFARILPEVQDFIAKQ